MKRSAISSCSRPGQRPRPAAPRLQREHDVLAHREIGDDAVGLAVLRAEAEAGGDRVARRGESDRRCPRSDACRCPARRRRRAPRAVSVRPEPSSPATPTTSPWRNVRSKGCDARPLRPKSLKREQRRCRLRAAGACRWASPRQARGRASCWTSSTRSRARPFGRVADQPAVAQHRDAVGDLEDLVEEMGDEDDAEAAALQLAHHRRTASRTSCASRLAVGSSRISTLPDSSTARAMAMICWMATE